VCDKNLIRERMSLIRPHNGKIDGDNHSGVGKLLQREYVRTDSEQTHLLRGSLNTIITYIYMYSIYTEMFYCAPIVGRLLQ